MTSNSNDRDGQGDVDPGEPISELADLAEDPPPGFLSRLSRRIDIKVLGTQLIDLGRSGVGSFFSFYWNLLTSLLSGGKDDGGKGN